MSVVSTVSIPVTIVDQPAKLETSIAFEFVTRKVTTI
jgi:hypothetical protein